jgi:hypothetical protein
MGIFAALALFLWFTHPTLPPLLRDVSAGGGWWGACPPEGDGRRELALSPELNRRLEDQFPPGTSEQRLIRVVSDQGFHRAASCQSDPTIHIATFGRPDMRAAVYWKSDDAGSIVWTKGFVFYIAP